MRGCDGDEIDGSNTTRWHGSIEENCDFLDALATRYLMPRFWESGRMNFWRYNVHADKDPEGPFFRENVHVWRAEDGAMVALFISEYGGDAIFIEVMPEYRAL